MDFEVSKIRRLIKTMAPEADFETPFNFYYDETNNIKKFYVRENDFNYTFSANFVLGGLVHVGSPPNVQSLIASLKLQNTTTEIKFKHIANGTFLECLKSNRLTLFLDFVLRSDLYIHYSSLNILYWAIVDIVDSAIVGSEVAKNKGLPFVNHLKNDLYKLARLEIASVIDLFYRYQYPNIKKDKIIPFIEDLVSLFDSYIYSIEFHLGLESLRQLLEGAKKREELAFIMDDEDNILLKDLSQFYLRPIYMFKNSFHIFDNEDSISEILSDFRVLEGDFEIKNYSFVDSKSNILVQLSDVFVGLIGKLTRYFNTSTREQIQMDMDALSEIQRTNINLLIDNIDKSHQRNIGFLHSTDSIEEMSKIDIVRKNRVKNHT